MCGIAGIAGGLDASAENHLKCLQKALRHRGPDDEGWFISPNRDSGLIHTRLAILTFERGRASANAFSRRELYHRF